MSQERPKEPSRKPTLPLGTTVTVGAAEGIVVALRARKKFARRYLVLVSPDACVWLRRDQLAVS